MGKETEQDGEVEEKLHQRHRTDRSQKVQTFKKRGEINLKTGNVSDGELRLQLLRAANCEFHTPEINVVVCTVSDL